MHDSTGPIRKLLSPSCVRFPLPKEGMWTRWWPLPKPGELHIVPDESAIMRYRCVECFDRTYRGPLTGVYRLFDRKSIQRMRAVIGRDSEGRRIFDEQSVAWDEEKGVMAITRPSQWPESKVEQMIRA